MLIKNKNGSIGMSQNKVHFYVLSAIIFGLLTIAVPLIYSIISPTDSLFNNDANSAFYSINISEDPNFNSASTSLNADTIISEIGMTYTSINFDEIVQNEGQYIDPDFSYLAYSFYIMNMGTETISVDYYMRITDVFNSMDQYVRILVIEDNTIYHMYQKADQPDADSNMPVYDQLPLGIEFESDLIIFRDTINDFKPDEIKSIRVIIWLEEQDPDIDINQQSGLIRAQMGFSINLDQLVDLTDTRLLGNGNENIWMPVSMICVVGFVVTYETEEIT